MTVPEYRISQLDALEAESIHIIREVVAELERPVLLFSRRQGLDRDAARWPRRRSARRASRSR